MQDSVSATKESPTISVLIPAYNEEALISPVIKAVRESFEAISWNSYEIVVCDNNSTDKTASMAASNGARVVFEPHNQIAKARNTAARSARGQWFLFLDADTFVTRELLEEMVRCIQSGTISLGGAVLRLDSDRVGWMVKGLLFIWNSISTVSGLAAGSFLFCRRDAWSEVGGFDEEYYAGEELFFSLKVKRWSKERGMALRIITNRAATTSSRKIAWYGPWRLTWKMVLMNIPGALKNRKLCDLWYTRPNNHLSANFNSR